MGAQAAMTVVPTPGQIEHAAKLLDPVFARTPVLQHTGLDGDTGASVLLKVETLNPIRSFKGRGADTWMREVGTDASGVVCASAGNFGQGLAYAARQRGIPCRVYVGRSANAGKVAAMRRLGADVEVGGDDYDAAIEAARAYAEETGRRFVEDGRDPWIAAGAGTMGLELIADGQRADVALVPVGNSALILGLSVWLRQHCPDIRIVGVCAEEAAAPALSWRERRVVTTASATTVADGIGVRGPFEESVAGMVDLVDDMVLVSESALRLAVRRVASETSLLAEAAGAAGVAALLAEPARYEGARVFTPLCGGNLPPDAVQWSPAWQD